MQREIWAPFLNETLYEPASRSVLCQSVEDILAAEAVTGVCDVNGAIWRQRQVIEESARVTAYALLWREDLLKFAWND